MSLKRDLKVLSDFNDNPHDATYRPEKEMIKLFIGLMVTLPIFLGLCYKFFILAVGPLFIYWIVFYFRSAEYWKSLGWKRRWYYLPAIPLTLLGLYLAATGTLLGLIGSFFTLLFGK